MRSDIPSYTPRPGLPVAPPHNPTSQIVGFLERLRQQLAAVSSPKVPDDERQAAWARLDRSRLLRLMLLFLAAVTCFVTLWPTGGTLVPPGDFLKTGFYGLLVFATAVFHLSLGHRESIFRSNRRILVVFGVMLSQIALIRFLANLDGGDNDVAAVAAIRFAPLALAPICLCVLFGQRLGIFAALYTSLWGGLIVGPESAPFFVVLSLGCGLIGIASTLRVRKRSRLIQAGFHVGLAHLALILFANPNLPAWGNFDQAEWLALLRRILGTMGVELATVIILSGVLPILEWLGDITTDISWIELSDLNHPLLKRMTMEAPGTYHHSLVVSTLAEAAAECVGANETMVRVCAYFHDIGKLENPGFFIENQGGGINPHDSLTPQMSALKIIAHVRDGVALAQRQHLNRRILAVIREHHGDSLVAYFHHRALNLRQEQLEEVAKGLRKEEDVANVDPDDFRYPGPKPSTKESAIISLADAVESASRSLKSPTPADIRDLIDRLIAERLRDGQLSESPLTLREITLIRESFHTTLKSLLHGRVPYPAETPTEIPVEKPDNTEPKPAAGS